MISSLYIDSLQLLPDDGLGSIGGLYTLEGLGSPAPRRDIISRSRAHGDIDFSKYYGGRVISLSGYTVGPDMTTAWNRFDQLKSALQLGTDHLLKFRRFGQSDDEQMYVRVASNVDAPLKGASTIINWSLDVFAPDPRMYGATLRTGSYDPTTSGSAGLDLPIVWPLIFGGSTGSHLILNNGGNFPTQPIFTIEGPVVNPIIDNDTTGESFYTTGLSLAAGETATVDMDTRKLTIGSTVRQDYVDATSSVWFALVPGDNLIRLRGSGTVGGVSALSAAYRDARI